MPAGNAPFGAEMHQVQHMVEVVARREVEEGPEPQLPGILIPRDGDNPDDTLLLGGYVQRRLVIFVFRFRPSRLESSPEPRVCY